MLYLYTIIHRYFHASKNPRICQSERARSVQLLCICFSAFIAHNSTTQSALYTWLEISEFELLTSEWSRKRVDLDFKSWVWEVFVKHFKLKPKTALYNGLYIWKSIRYGDMYPRSVQRRASVSRKASYRIMVEVPMQHSFDLRRPLIHFYVKTYLLGNHAVLLFVILPFFLQKCKVERGCHNELSIGL